jgi:hypothetical protein
VIEKIDVCVVTRDGSLPKGLEFIPQENLIIETSAPLGEARRKAIDRVKTEWFAFIDDDMEIQPYWFNNLANHIDEKTGGIWGIIQYKGLGKYFNESTDIRQNYRILRLNERFNTNNTLFRTDLVKDWIPSPNLTCYEDLELGIHIMKKGYNLKCVPGGALHWRSWNKMAKNAVWAGRTYRKTLKPNFIQYISEYFKRLFWNRITAILKHGVFFTILSGWRDVFFVYGMLTEWV